MKKNLIFIITYSIIACFILFLSENFYKPEYIFIVIQKVLLFIIIPIIISYYLGIKKGSFGIINQKSFIYGISFGILGALVIFLSYYFLNNLIGWDLIKASINERGVNENTFIFIFIYIMFGNALMEEYFFRGFIFNIIKNNFRIFGYIFSSFLFSLYHITIFGTWFSGFLLGLALFGLFLGGLFFSFLYERTKGIWAAYIFHIIADLSILVIGYFNLFR